MKLRRPPRPLLIAWLGALAVSLAGFAAAAAGLREGAMIGSTGGVAFVLTGILIYVKTPRT